MYEKIYHRDVAHLAAGTFPGDALDLLFRLCMSGLFQDTKCMLYKCRTEVCFRTDWCRV